jgi:hypothetical protein
MTMDTKCNRQDPEGNPAAEDVARGEHGEHVASFSGAHHVVERDSSGDYHVYRRAQARTTDNDERSGLQRLNWRNREFWERRAGAGKVSSE